MSTKYNKNCAHKCCINNNNNNNSNNNIGIVYSSYAVCLSHLGICLVFRCCAALLAFLVFVVLLCGICGIPSSFTLSHFFCPNKFALGFTLSHCSRAHFS